LACRHLVGLQRSEGQRPVGDELALRDENDAGDGEDQHQGQRQQRIDGAAGDAILTEEKEDLQIHKLPESAASNAVGAPRRR